MNCPCGSERSYETCCLPVIRGERAAASPEELMRARYSAYTQVEMDFLQTSLHPDARETADAEGAREWAEESEWHGLTVLGTVGGGPADETGEVEFIASYTYDDEEQLYHEVAEFARVDGVWYFKEGRPGVKKPVVHSEPRAGRNDPCPCGSGRKYKRCCGS